MMMIPLMMIMGFIKQSLYLEKHRKQLVQLCLLILALPNGQHKKELTVLCQA